MIFATIQSSMGKIMHESFKKKKQHLKNTNNKPTSILSSFLMESSTSKNVFNLKARIQFIKKISKHNPMAKSGRRIPKQISINFIS